ncbi:MAG: dioxygenase [bacterium]|nr:dioxygenase [bacterium]
MTRTSRAPSLFVSHGAPSLALDREHGADFVRLGEDLAGVQAILVVSAHWQASPPTIGTTSVRPLLHDYTGFAPALREVIYDAPVAAELAARVEALVPGVKLAANRPWDHGVWVPLVHMRAAADLPVLQLSLPSSLAPSELLALGRGLRPLRDEGVAVLASGGLVHNLGALDWTGDAAPPAWSLEFEGGVREALRLRDVDALVAARERFSTYRLAHPTDEHFLPLLIALGAVDVDREAVSFPIEGFEFGSLSRLAVLWG